MMGAPGMTRDAWRRASWRDQAAELALSWALGMGLSLGFLVLLGALQNA